jgi:hypothetical protein
MNATRAITLVVSILIVLVISLGIFRLLSAPMIAPETPAGAPIMTFEDCANGGGKVIPGTSPAQCQAPGGRLFVQEKTPPPTPPPPAGSASSTDLSDLIQVSSPLPNALVKSPIAVTGVARGNWYFEATFPITLVDANGKILAQQPVQAQGDWMTTEFVPFAINLAFAPSSATSGELILHNDNPSGLPQNDKEIRIPVRFK